VYRSADLYDAVLAPHYYGGVDDVDLVGRLMAEHFGEPGERGELTIAEFGCGTGRVTSCLAPHARRLVGIDSSRSMIAAFETRFPRAETRCLRTQAAVAQLLDEGLGEAFDVVGAFWSLSYPLGEFFEAMTEDGIRPVADVVTARASAGRLVQDLLALVAPGGHLLALFFDSETREQRLVTRLWERIAPFPDGGRAYTRQLLLDELRAAEDRGVGWLTHTRRGGVAVAPSEEAAHAWFNHLHLKDFPTLVDDPDVQREVGAFVRDCTIPNGTVLIPSGVHVIDFHATADPLLHLPSQR